MGMTTQSALPPLLSVHLYTRSMDRGGIGQCRGCVLSVTTQVVCSIGGAQQTEHVLTSVHV